MRLDKLRKYHESLKTGCCQCCGKQSNNRQRSHGNNDYLCPKCYQTEYLALCEDLGILEVIHVTNNKD